MKATVQTPRARSPARRTPDPGPLIPITSFSPLRKPAGLTRLENLPDPIANRSGPNTSTTSDNIDPSTTAKNAALQSMSAGGTALA
jgi:hypothetical protein